MKTKTSTIQNIVTKNKITSLIEETSPDTSGDASWQMKKASQTTRGGVKVWYDSSTGTLNISTD